MQTIRDGSDRGFTLVELLMTLGGVVVLALLAGQYWNWGSSDAQEQAYVRSLEDVLTRSMSYAQKLEQPIAVCFLLSEFCVAEGVLSAHINTSDINSEPEWHLLEALPMKMELVLRTNFPQNRLIIEAGGQSVQRPGTLYVCSIEPESTQAWRITIARSGRLTTKKVEKNLESEAACGIAEN